jgi:hypothetical protein
MQKAREMKEHMSALERAFTLARSGDVSGLTELRARLRKEGYGNEPDAIWGKGLKMELANLIANSRQPAGNNLRGPCDPET